MIATTQYKGITTDKQSNMDESQKYNEQEKPTENSIHYIAHLIWSSSTGKLICSEWQKSE